MRTMKTKKVTKKAVLADRRAQEHDYIIHEMGLLAGEAEGMWTTQEDFARRRAEWFTRANALNPRACVAGLEGWWIELFAGAPPDVSTDVTQLLKSRAELERRIASEGSAA
jgi:hypothetical protein